ncbi:hypothetical protein [Gordonia shandongensis]|uniref:hypothetical protein n=1 Tax=Gordonia shandongensis TaxID=376351 RepID=UPI00146C6D02|nr:hypothetical protein [Gordonia shandongensis]
MSAIERPAVRIAAFTAAAVVVFGAAFGVGRAVGPWDEPSADPTVQIHEAPRH